MEDEDKIHILKNYLVLKSNRALSKKEKSQQNEERLKELSNLTVTLIAVKSYYGER
jgi:hypothetical protein